VYFYVRKLFQSAKYSAVANKYVGVYTVSPARRQVLPRSK